MINKSEAKLRWLGKGNMTLILTIEAYKGGQYAEWSGRTYVKAGWVDIEEEEEEFEGGIWDIWISKLKKGRLVIVLRWDMWRRL